MIGMAVVGRLLRGCVSTPGLPAAASPRVRPCWLSSHGGQSFTEYAVIMAVVVVVAVTAVVQLGGAIDTVVVDTVAAFQAVIAPLL